MEFCGLWNYSVVCYWLSFRLFAAGVGHIGSAVIIELGFYDK